MKKLLELYFCFFKIGGLTFGGGLAALPMLKREIVQNKQWVDEEELLDIYAIGQCTPGIIAVNTATYIGYQQARSIGGIVATLGVISPSLIIILIIAALLSNYMENEVLLHAFAGIRIVVCALMLNTLVSIARKGIVDKLGFLLFLVTFALALFTPIPTVLLVIAAGLAGIIAKRKEGKRR